MALGKLVRWPNGVAPYYHRISQVTWEPQGTLTLIVESYLTKEGRFGGDVPFTVGNFRYEAGKWPDTWTKGASLTPAELYGLLKAHMDFEGAEDI